MKLLIGILIGFCLPIIVFYLFLKLGGMPVATKAPPLPLERFIAKTAIHAALKNESGKASPIAANEQNLLAGAKIYTTHCAVCHNLPDGESSPIAKGLFPKPPRLLRPHSGVTRDPIGETFWTIKNGIRLSGMPAYEDSLSELEMWQVSELLLNGDKLPGTVRSALAPPEKHP